MAIMVIFKGIILTLVVIVPVYWLASRVKVKIRFFLLGALAWLLAVFGKVLAVLPAQKFSIFLENHGIMPEASLSLYSGLLTGVFECGIVLLFALYLKSLKNCDWNDQIGFGVGFAGLESLIPGVALLIFGFVLLGYPEVVNHLSPETRNLAIPAANINGVLMVVASFVERLGALALHTFSALLIFLAVRTKVWKWFWVAFIYKFSVDATSSNLKFIFGDRVYTSVSILWIVESILLVFDILGFAGILYLRKKWKKQGV